MSEANVDGTKRDSGATSGKLDKVTVYQMRCKEGVQHAIWDVEQAMHLREKYGLLGDLVGTLPKHLSQNQFLSMPLLLNDDEVRYGLQHEVIRVVSDYPNDYRIPSKEAAEQFEKAFKDDLECQVEEAVEKQRAERQVRAPIAATSSRKRKRSLVDSEDDVEEQTVELMQENEGLDITGKQVGITNEPRRNHDKQTNGNVNGNCNSKDKRNVNDDDDEDNDDVEQHGPAKKKMRHAGLLERISDGVRSAFQSIISLNPRLPSSASPAATSMNEDPAKDGNEKILMNGAVGGNTAGDGRDEEEERKSNAEEAREAMLDDKARRQAMHSSLVVTSSSAREDEVDDSTRQELNLNHIPVPCGMTHIQRWRRRRIYDDLKAKGYYLSCGAKFGADFLAYAGDPQLFHAALAVVVVDGNQLLHAREIVGLGRLGDATRKRTVLAWVDNEQLQVEEDAEKIHHVHYVGVQWEETLP